MKLSEIADILTAGEKCGLLQSLRNAEPLGYSIDSRSIRVGELFFAIRGENNDGHRFVGSALESGALGAVVETGFADSDGRALEGRLIRVPDTLLALQSLASAVISSWRGREVAITGSSGKTTTKDITARLLSSLGPTLKSTGNLNNAYGLPLSVLKMESDGKRPWDFEYAVLEMGMNHKGEIARLTEIAPPAIGVVTNVSAVHLEFFRSVDEIAEAKSEMIAGIRPGGEGVLNQDDPRVSKMRTLRADVEFTTFGIEERAHVMARDIQFDGPRGIRFVLTTPEWQSPASLPLFGRHNLYNALAGVAVARLCGAELDAIVEALAACATSKMRGEIVEFSEGFRLVDDSYNSNPTALAALVAAFNKTEGRKVVVAGEMLELGEEGPALHREAGRKIAGEGIGFLIGVRGLAQQVVAGARGAGMKASDAVFAETPEEAAEILIREVRAGDLILVKGSRGVKMEGIIEIMKRRFVVKQ